MFLVVAIGRSFLIATKPVFTCVFLIAYLMFPKPSSSSHTHTGRHFISQGMKTVSRILVVRFHIFIDK